jgi:hypothetical protein
MAIELTNYMKRELYLQGFKDFAEGIQSSGFTTPEWDALWRKGWECAKAEAEQLANSENGTIW